MLLSAEAICGTDPFQAPLRVLHVLQPTEAGVWRYVHDMAVYQAEHGWDVHLASGRDIAGPVHWHPWHATRNPLRSVRSEMKGLQNILRTVRPDVIVAHSAKAGVVVRLTVRGRYPTVFLPHAWSFSAMPGPLAVAGIAWERYAARYNNAIAGVGAGEIARGIRCGIRAPYFLVPNPVPPGWPMGGSESAASVPPRAAFVGRLSRQKGVDVLIEAWRLVRARLPEAELVIAGDGPLADALVRAAGPGVTFLGYQADPSSIVASAGVIVIPSRWEGLSLSMLEAMASGRSLVVTDVDGAEVVRAARAGAVVPVDDPNRLAHALLERLTNPQVAQGEGLAGASYVAEHHDFDNAARRLSAVIVRSNAFGETVRPDQRNHAPLRGR